MSFFEELILISLGKKDEFSKQPSPIDWKDMLEKAQKHSILGILLSGIERLPESQRPPELTFMAWFGYTNIIAGRNRLLDKRAAELTVILKEGGFSSCILKGQGVARLYPQPERRMSGDIDIWVVSEEKEQPNRIAILDFLKHKRYQLGDIIIHHVDTKVFNDVETEIHFTPSFTYDPFRTRKFKKYFQGQAYEQCYHYDENLGFSYPTNGFNAVYSLIHIYRHVFIEGIGLRQLLDYYYVLISLTELERKNALDTLTWMRLDDFTAAVMYVQQKIFQLSDCYFLCTPNEKGGSFLLSEIMLSGNFGKFDERIWGKGHNSLAYTRYIRLARLSSFLKYYPSEVLWAPFWKVWHYFWRMQFAKYKN